MKKALILKCVAVTLAVGILAGCQLTQTAIKSVATTGVIIASEKEKYCGVENTFARRALIRRVLIDEPNYQAVCIQDERWVRATKRSYTDVGD